MMKWIITNTGPIMQTDELSRLQFQGAGGSLMSGKEDLHKSGETNAFYNHHTFRFFFKGEFVCGSNDEK